MPALLTGVDALPTFLASGLNGRIEAGRFGFQIASDRDRVRTVIFDPSDGMPILISNGRELLAYDLEGERIVRFPVANASIRVDWDVSQAQPFTFNFSFNVAGSTATLKPDESAVRMDRFVRAEWTELTRLEAAAGQRLFAYEKPDDGTIYTLQVPTGDVDEFRLTALAKDEDKYLLEMQVDHIGQAIPETALRFPDANALAQSVKVEVVNPAEIKTMMINLFSKERGNKLGLMKFLDGGKPETTAAFDLDEAREADAKLGKAYREALEAQGIRFPAEVLEPKTTSPHGE